MAFKDDPHLMVVVHLLKKYTTSQDHPQRQNIVHYQKMSHQEF